MRPLHGPGHHGELLDVVEPAVIAEPILRPREADDLERFVEARAVLGHGDAEAVELRRDGAAPHSELEAAPGQEIRSGYLLRTAQWMVKGGEGDPGANADALRARADAGNGQEREGAPEVQLGQPRDVEAQRVGEVDDVEHLSVALGVRLPGCFRRLEEETESHGPPSIQHRGLLRSSEAEQRLQIAPEDPFLLLRAEARKPLHPRYRRGMP